jgi:hypothetical protein
MLVKGYLFATEQDCKDFIAGKNIEYNIHPPLSLAMYQVMSGKIFIYYDEELETIYGFGEPQDFEI